MSGIDFANKLYSQTEELGATFTFENITSINLTATPKEIVTDAGMLKAKTVILATGAKPKKLDVPGEDRLTGAGVSYCATCDGAFHKGNDVVIVGGGNTAIEDALVLSGICRKVYLVHRRKEFRAENHVLELLRARENVEWITDAAVSEIVGQSSVEAVEVTDLLSGNRQSIAVSGIFIAIGFSPDNKLFGSDLHLDSQGYIIADESCLTNLPGVFAAGDTRTKKIRQIVTATADGAVAALAAGEYITTSLR